MPNRSRDPSTHAPETQATWIDWPAVRQEYAALSRPARRTLDAVARLVARRGGGRVRLVLPWIQRVTHQARSTTYAALQELGRAGLIRCDRERSQRLADGGWRSQKGWVGLVMTTALTFLRRVRAGFLNDLMGVQRGDAKDQTSEIQIRKPGLAFVRSPPERRCRAMTAAQETQRRRVLKAQAELCEVA